MTNRVPMQSRMLWTYLFILVLMTIATLPVSAAAPVAAFSGTPTTGTIPFTVTFTDLSTNSPSGWAWFFGDETYTAPWTQMTANAGWSARHAHTSVAMPDGSIVLMGGYDNIVGDKNDVWRSTDKGATWTQMTASAGWAARDSQNSVVMSDGSIVLMGGGNSITYFNDVWRSTDNGVTWTQMTASAGWSARGCHSSVVMPDGSIILMGGQDSGGYKNDVWKSTDKGATWTQITASSGWSARHAQTSVVMPDSSIVLMGGQDIGGYKNDVWRSTNNGATWTQMTASAGWSQRSYQTSVTMPDGSIILIGGYNGGYNNDVWRSTDNGVTWSQVTASPGWSARAWHSSVMISDSSIVLTGGFDSSGSYKNDVWRFVSAGSSVQNPSHTYTATGVYQVALQAFNTAGYNSMRKTGYITVTAISPPVANFIGTPTTGTAPLTVTFTDISTNTPTAWNWSFGDGSSVNSTVKNPVHSYASAGNYPVSLTVMNAAGSDSKTVANYITVSSGVVAPVASFVGTPTSGVAPLTVTFSDRSTNTPTGWAWFFGDETYTVPWTQQTPSAGWIARGWHSSVAMPDGSIVLMGGWYNDINLNDVWRSTDNGATWIQQTASAGWSTRHAQSSVTMPDGSIVLTGGYSGGSGKNDTWRSTDNGVTWTQRTASSGWMSRGYHSSVAMPDGSIVLMGGLFNGIYKNDTWRSTDNGATWTQMNPSSGWSVRSSHYSVAMPDSSIILMGGWDGSNVKNDTWRSTDNGATWTQMNASSGWSARSGHSSVAMPDGSIVLMGGLDGVFYNDVWRSTDNGATWTLVTASSGWSPRKSYSSVAMPDGSIVLMGGYIGANMNKNDTWRLIPSGSSVKNPSYTYTSAGIYQVALQAFNTAGYNSMRKSGYITVTAISPPVANFLGTPTTGTAPLTVTFTDISTNTPTAWNWSFGDGSSVNSTVKNPVHSYTSAGNYSVSLTVTNAAGSDTKTVANYITVSSGVVAPVANFLGIPTTGTAPLTVTFTDISTNTPTVWSWSFGDGSSVNSTVQNPVHSYSSAGNYSVSLTVTNAAGSDTKTVANYITVSSGVVAPVANFLGTPTTGTVPLTVTFTDTSINSPTAWNWSFGDGSLSSVQNPSHTYNSTGTYTVSLTATNAYGSDTKTLTNYITVILSGPPVADFLGTPTSGTVPLTVYFVDNSANFPTSWMWNFGDGSESPVQNPYHLYTATGTYTVSLKATNAYGSDTKIQSNYISVSSPAEPGGGGGSDPSPVVQPVVPPVLPPVIPVQPPIVLPPNVPAGAPVDAFASYPMGFEGLSYNDAGDGTLSLDLDAASKAGAIVIPYNNRVEVYQHSSPGVLITFWGDRFDTSGRKITGKVNRAEFVTDPLALNVPFGNVTGSVRAELPALTQRVYINNTISNVVDATVTGQFVQILSQNNLSLDSIAFTMKLQRVNLINGPANVTLTIPLLWVNQHGGIDAVRITRISDTTGKTELLNTVYTGTDPNGNIVFRGDSPNGTSIFGLVTAKATALEQQAHPNETFIPPSRPAMITNVGMFSWLFGIISNNPVLIVILIAVLIAAVYFGWWKRRL